VRLGFGRNEHAKVRADQFRPRRSRTSRRTRG
jgi:hypothetical protein